MSEAKINIAINKYDEYIHIDEAISGGKYSCVYCKDRLTAIKGNKQIHHYRHYAKNEFIECALYSSTDSDYSILYYESQHVNKLRFVINRKLELKMKFPYLSEKAQYQMNAHNYYFTIKVDNKNLFSGKLIKPYKENYLPVKLSEKYKISYENKRHAKILEYETLSQIQLISNKPVLFKEISGEFINIPYSKTNLSEEFFLLSKYKLDFIDGIKMKSYEYINGMHAYYLCVDEINDLVISWFKRNTDYTIVKNRKWLDIIYPDSFMYDEITLIDKAQIKIKVTPYNQKDMMTYISPDNKTIQVPFNKVGVAEIFLDKNYVYNFSLNHEIANELTIKRVDELNNEGFLYPIYINDELMDINKTINFKEKIHSIESEQKVDVYSTDKNPLPTSRIESKDIQVVHIPYIATYKLEQEQKIDKKININEIIRLNRWNTSTAEEYQMILNYVKQSKIDNKNRHIKKLQSNYNKLPAKLLYELRRGR